MGPEVLDWDDLRFFLAVARRGSLTTAAKDLRVAQSTVGRRLSSLETNLGARLLHRTPDGYTLTLAGHDVLRQAERVEIEALGVERSVGGRDAKLEGVVRVTCTETMAAHVLAPCFAALQEIHSGILVELMPNPNVLSLSMREADIAVRLVRSNEHDLVVRRIGLIAFGLYASPDLPGTPWRARFRGRMRRASCDDAARRCGDRSASKLALWLGSARQARIANRQP